MKIGKKKKRILELSLLAGLGYLVVFYLVPSFFSIPEKLTAPQEPGVSFTDRNGEPLRRLLADDLRIDRPAAIEEIPEHLVEATLAAEDTRFYSHNGIDYLGVLRAARDAVRHRKLVSGASTVTQQLIKITSIPRPRNGRTKVIEMMSARKLEMHWTKDDILAAYFNRLPYGNLLTGCRAAARGYFGKPLGDLSIAESAFLAGLPNAPTRLNPYRNYEGAKQRQLWILGRMLEEKMITETEFAAAKSEPLRIHPRGTAVFHAPHFVDLVRQHHEEFPEKTVETTLDLKLQQFVEDTIESRLEALDQETGQRLRVQAAAVVIENETGNVLALAGSRNFFRSEAGQVNGAWIPRSPGSALKPFTYLLALEKGFTAAAILDDLPVEYLTPSGNYEPVNYDRRFRGPVPVRQALANSLNVPAVRLLDSLGGPPVLHQALAEKLGLTGLDPDPGNYGLGLTLGTAEVRLLELTNAYACLARLGEFRPYRLATSTDVGSFEKRSRFDRNTSWILADILSDNRARASQFGLNSPLRLPFRVAAKTGTSTDYRDNWTLGFTPDFTVGIWVGQFDNHPLQNISGVSGAGPIFHAVMSELHRDKTPSWYPRPSGIVEVPIDPLTGKRVDPEALGFRPRHTRLEVFRRDRLPPMASVSDYDLENRVILPPRYAAWYASDANHLRSRTSIRNRIEVPSLPALGSAELRILSPLDGTTAILDPDLPEAGRRFPLRVEGGGPVRWTSETLTIEQSDDDDWVILEPGRHRVIATDPRTGARAVTEIEVEAL